MNLQLFGGRGSAGGNNPAGRVDRGVQQATSENDINDRIREARELQTKASAERADRKNNPDRIKANGITTAREASNQVYDMISPNSSIANSFTDRERTATLRTYIDRVIQNPRAFWGETIANQRVLEWAESHGGSSRFPKLKTYRQTVKKIDGLVRANRR